MSDLGDLFKNAGVSEEQIKAIVLKLKDNPASAMAAVQELNLSEEVMGKLLGTVMMNPGAIDELAAELGIDQSDIDLVKKQMQNPGASDA